MPSKEFSVERLSLNIYRTFEAAEITYFGISKTRAGMLQTYKIMHNFNLRPGCALSSMPTTKDAPAVSNPVHAGPEFEVIYTGSQKGVF